MTVHAQGLGSHFESFVTTAENGGPRTPIHGERIVVVLGREEGGRPLEISIYLRPWPGNPNDLAIAALTEEARLNAPPAYQPRLVVEPSPALNLIFLHVDQRPLTPDEKAMATDLST